MGEHDGRRFEVRLDDLLAGGTRVKDHRVRLHVDGTEVNAVPANGKDTVLRAPGVEVQVRMTVWATKATRADLVLPGGRRIPLTEIPAPAAVPEEGTGDPGQGWWHRVRPVDLVCGAGFAVMVLYGWVLRPLRPFLLGAPLVWAAVTGSTAAVVTLGAATAVGRVDLWWLGVAAAAVSVAKFDPLWWWAGRLWGDRVLAVFGGRVSRTTRSERLQRWIVRWRGPAIAASYVPPLPTALILATAGASGMRLRNFVLVDLAAAAVSRCVFFYLGYRIGQPVLDVIDLVASQALWLSLGSVVVVLAVSEVRRRRGARTAGSSVPVG